MSDPAALLAFAIVALVGYGIGSISSGYLVGKIYRNVDLRTVGSGSTGGAAWFIPPEDKSYHSIIEFKDVLARMLGGRAAEEIIYGPDRVTTGAGSDLRRRGRTSGREVRRACR